VPIVACDKDGEEGRDDLVVREHLRDGLGLSLDILFLLCTGDPGVDVPAALAGAAADGIGTGSRSMGSDAVDAIRAAGAELFENVFLTEEAVAGGAKPDGLDSTIPLPVAQGGGGDGHGGPDGG
jgi:hypothetical protein